MSPRHLWPGGQGQLEAFSLKPIASDEKPEKEMARKMMRMTNRINKKFFHYKKEGQQEIAPIVTCKTCHNGMPRPEK